MGRGGTAGRLWVSAALVLGAVAVVAVGLVATSGGATARAPMLPPHPVAGQFRPDSTTLADCSEQTCYEQAFGNVAFRRGPKVALALFDRRIAENEDGCHRIAHAIGAASLARYHGNVARTFALGSSSCWSGYYHGVLERSLLTAGAYTRTALADVARSLCADPGVRAVTWLAFQCLHGLGHGLMISTGNDLPRSLDVCRRLDGSGDAEACKGGVFMENLSPMYGTGSRWLRDDDPLYPCTAVAKSDRYECYKRVTTRILAVVGFDWEQVAQICASLERSWASACFTSFGRDVSAQNHRDPGEIVRLCEIAHPYGAEQRCIDSAARDITGNDGNGARAAALCASISAGMREQCFAAVGSIVGRFRPTALAREADCRALSPVRPDVAACVRGARTGSRMIAIR